MRSNDRIFRPDILRQAWEEVRRNGGSAGQDGVTIEDVEREGVEQFLREIEQGLRAGTYRPQTGFTCLHPQSGW